MVVTERNKVIARMRYRRVAGLVLALAMILLGPGGSAQAVAATSVPVSPAREYLRVLYYREGKNARASFLGNPKSVDVFAPQAYSLNRSGKLAGSVDPKLLAFARKHGIRVMPLVTNRGFDQEQSQIFLNNPAKQDAAVRALVREAKKQKFWGWQFDFEQLDASYRDKYSAFIAKASAALRKNGFAVSVAVVAQVSETPGDYPKTLWQDLIGVYDYAALASSTDFVSVMSYDDPGSPGPIARYSWLQQVIAHGLKSIPAEKFSLGIPFYYWKWDDTRGKIVGIGGYEGIQRIRERHFLTPGYSDEEQAPFLRYATSKKQYTIWYENARSIQRKVELVTANGLHGFSAWALGLETPEVHRVLQE